VIITRAEIAKFRNLSEISLTPDPKYNIITGNNAQGKTNLLESLWILSGCKSFRGAKEKDFIPLDDSKMSSKIKVLDSIREHTIKFELDSTGSKLISLNGVKQKGSKSLFDVFKCISFTPEDAEIVRGSPEKRRNFIDMSVSQLNPSFISHINRFNVIMNHRNSLLKSISLSQSDKSTLEIWDRQASSEGSYISFMRSEYVKKINAVCGNLYKRISGGNESLSLEYRSNVFKADDLSENYSHNAVNKYFSKLSESAEYDIRTGQTHLGAGRDDVLIKINGCPAKIFGSQGQIKSTALVMKLSQAEIFAQKSKDPPVIFLDDVMGELDEKRQKFIFSIIKDMQVFLTTPNENSILPEINGKIIRINGGRCDE